VDAKKHNVSRARGPAAASSHMKRRRKNGKAKNEDERAYVDLQRDQTKG